MYIYIRILIQIFLNVGSAPVDVKMIKSDYLENIFLSFIILGQHATCFLLERNHATARAFYCTTRKGLNNVERFGIMDGSHTIMKLEALRSEYEYRSYLRYTVISKLQIHHSTITISSELRQWIEQSGIPPKMPL